VHRDSVRRILEHRLGTQAATELKPALETIDDPDILAELIEPALLCERVEDFHAAVRRVKRRRRKS
jgi:hypothetical protein